MDISLQRVSDQVGELADAAGRWVGKGWPVVPLVAFSLLLFLPALAPILKSLVGEPAARPLYALFSLICHQQPDHCLWLAGFPMAVCSRDTGLFAGGFLGSALFQFTRHPRLPWPVVLLCLAPLAIDGGTQLLGLRESHNLLRLLTGILAGGPAIHYLLTQLSSVGDGASGPPARRII